MKRLEYFAIEKDIYCPINLGIGVNPYPNSKEGLAMNNTFKSGVRWIYNDIKIELTDDFYVTGYPSADNNSFIAIYSQKSTKILKPNNAIIYNSDGSINSHINMPDKLLSSNAKRINPPQSDWSFNQANWYNDSNGEKIVGIWISFARGEYYEIRELDTNTGIIGKLISYGRM